MPAVKDTVGIVETNVRNIVCNQVGIAITVIDAIKRRRATLQLTVPPTAENNKRRVAKTRNMLPRPLAEPCIPAR